MTRRPDALPTRTKSSLAVRIFVSFLRAHWEVRRHPLPLAVRRLETGARRPNYYVPPKRLGNAVVGVLWLSPRKPRCLFTALVLYRLLRAQGDDAELVIGLHEATPSKDAHAWIEIGGVDVGPPPGRSGHVELTRYGGNGAVTP